MRSARKVRATGSGASRESAPLATEIFPQSLSPPVASQRVMRGYIRPGNFVRKASLGKLAEACLGRMCLVGPIDARIQHTLRANVDGIPEVMFELLECRIGGEQHVPDDPRSPVCPLAKI